MKIAMQCLKWPEIATYLVLQDTAVFYIVTYVEAHKCSLLSTSGV